MRYLTKEWYNLCQRTGLHFGMEVYNRTETYDEALYLQLYKAHEESFIKMQHESYDYDPRFLLQKDSFEFVPFNKFVTGEEISEEDRFIYHIPPQEKEHIKKKIAEYDARPPFNEDKCREEFRCLQEIVQKDMIDKLPKEILQQIADIRVFALGYCTKDILDQLESVSKENEREMNRVLNECVKAQQAEQISHSIRGKFNFHDCEVTELTLNDNIIIRFDTRGGFTNYNTITFIDSKIIKQDDHILGSTWIYEELYRIENGYEAHMLFWGEEMPELIIRCKDILIEEK